MKDLYTDNATIGEYIYDTYVSGLKDSPILDIKKEIPLLVNNDMATSLNDNGFIGDGYPSLSRVGSKFIQKYNKGLKKYRAQIKPYEFGGTKNTMADADPELISLARKRLANGEYYAELDEDNYCVLSMQDGSDDDYASWTVMTTIAFIGDKCAKWKKKFEKMRQKYIDIFDSKTHECIRDMETGERQDTIFKPLDQLIFRDKDKVIEYIDNWVKNIPVYYNKYNMVAKLSIMLYGDPGTGKSTFARALAKYLGISNVVTVKPSYFTASNNDNNARRKSGSYMTSEVIAIDDIDCCCQSREDTRDADNNDRLANLLAFLDNPPTVYFTAKDGIQYPVSIVVASTNYYDRLDDAVKRYGRFDLKIHMPLFGRGEAEQMCDVYGLKLDDIVKDSHKKGFEISPSYLQALCLENIDKAMKEND